MTTIAYNHKDREIAHDGRTTRGDWIMSDSSEKMTEVNGVKFFLCGSVCDYDLMISMYFGAKSEVVPEANAFVIDGGKLFRIGCSSEAIFWKSPVECNDAMGSGSSWAIAAMDFGKSAVDAVKYAATRDNGTGGQIKVYQL